MIKGMAYLHPILYGFLYFLGYTTEAFWDDKSQWSPKHSSKCIRWWNWISLLIKIVNLILL